MSGGFTPGQRVEAGRARIASLQRTLADEGPELLLVLGSGHHDFQGANFVWWLAGVRQLGRDAAVLLPVEGEPVLVIAPSWDGVRAERRSWIDDVVAVDDPVAGIAEVLHHRRWRGTPVAIAGAATASGPLRQAVPALFDVVVADAGEAAVLAVASTHDDYAVGCLERAVAIADAGYRHLCEIVRPGMKEYELAAACEAHVQALGADDNFLLIAAAQHNRAVHEPTDRELSAGDTILAEISPSFDGHYAQICRSLVLGEPYDLQLARYEVLGRAFDAGLEMCRADCRVSAVAQAVDNAIAEAGYERYCRPPYMQTRGHAMGLGAAIPAEISARSEVVLAPGMSFVLHPNQYFPDVGYLLCGDQVVVTHDRPRTLSSLTLALDAVTSRVPA